MGALLTLSPDIISNEIATATRWQKLYRTIFNLFLKVDFVHKQDYLVDIAALNANITALEAKINTMDTAIAAHTHIAPQAPAGNLPTLPAAAGVPPYVVVPVVTPPVQHVDAFLNQEDAILQATGPSAAPLGQGVSPEVIKARVDIKQDIGLV